MKINLLTDIPTWHDATSFYRGIRPLKELSKAIPELNLTAVDPWTWASMTHADAVFMQRPYKDGHVVKMEIAKDIGLKLWVDYDDYLLGVPADNPNHAIYNSKETKMNILRCLAMADVVTVSTQALADLYKDFNKNIVVVNNAYEKRLYPYRKPAPRNKLVMWRGSSTHHRDAMGYAQPIIELQNDERFKDWTYHYVGDNLWFITEFTPHASTLWSEAIDVIRYFKHIHEVAPSLMMVPLHDSAFNRCKSNIAWIEATHAGGVALVPDWEEWKNPGALIYTDQASYRNHMESILKGEVDIEAMNKLSTECIEDKYDLVKLTQKRKAVLESIL